MSIGPMIILFLLALERHLPFMSLSTIPHTHLNHDGTQSLSLSSRHGHAQGRSMDVTASTLHRTSPLDLNIAKIRPLIKSGTYLEPIDTNVCTSSDAQAVSPTTPSDPSTLRFSSNAGIIEHYSQAWNTQDNQNDRTEQDFSEFEQLIGPTAGHTPRWPFINDESLNTPDSADSEPLSSPSRIPTTRPRPRPIYQIHEGLEDLADLYVPPLDSVPEAGEVEAHLPRPPPTSRISHAKVMTAAEFEALQKRKAREEAERRFYGGEEEEDDKVDYECIDDTEAVNRQKAQRKKQQAYLDGGYRQQMMKSTNGPDLPPLHSHSRISSSWSMKSFKAFQGLREDLVPRHDNEDEDEDVPLALLQIQRRSGSKAPSVINFGHMRGESISQLLPINIRQNSRIPMPEFARSLPQDIYPGPPQTAWPLNNQQIIPGGLVGVIASEERAKKARRVLPSTGFQPLPDTNEAFNWCHATAQPVGIAHSFGLPRAQTPMAFSRPQTPVAVPQLSPLHSNQEMFNLLQAQTEVLRSMATMNQRNNQSWNAFSSQQPVMNMGPPGAGSTYAPSQYAPSIYAKSNYAPSNYARSVYQQPGGYAASVAPSERNTIGLPSRYRPVSKAVNQTLSAKATKNDETMSLSNWDNNRSDIPRTSVAVEEDSTDDDDDAFWRAKREKRDKRRARFIQENDLGLKAEWIS
ncbi:hypothetical protein BFJ72_g4306 [Fusarium proliferatum]|uniref:Uncharacterized protein n=1 Tax=Gibberella intermedia TaxID=948311 RepID=A0A420TPR4_GIBIN|nr:hypothetical protein BFJ72_g4306 [Fusarium proliferatum]